MKLKKQRGKKGRNHRPQGPKPRSIDKDHLGQEMTMYEVGVLIPYKKLDCQNVASLRHWQKKGIKVTIIEPGWLRTGRFD